MIEHLVIIDHRSLPEKSRRKRSIRILINLQWSSLLLDPSTVGNNNFIRHLNSFILVMGNKNTGDPQLLDHILQPASKLRTDLCIDRRKRLIQKEKLRIRSQSPGKSNSLSLTTGQLTRISFLQALQPDQLYQFHNPLLNILLIRLLHLQAKCNIIIHRHIPEKSIILEHKSNASLAGRHIIDHSSVDDDLTAVRLLQTGDHTENRSFSASAGPQKTDQLPLFDTKAYVIRCLVIPICFIDIF